MYTCLLLVTIPSWMTESCFWILFCTSQITKLFPSVMINLGLHRGQQSRVTTKNNKKENNNKNSKTVVLFPELHHPIFSFILSHSFKNECLEVGWRSDTQLLHTMPEKLNQYYKSGTTICKVMKLQKYNYVSTDVTKQWRWKSGSFPVEWVDEVAEYGSKFPRGT